MSTDPRLRRQVRRRRRRKMEAYHERRATLLRAVTDLDQRSIVFDIETNPFYDPKFGVSNDVHSKAAKALGVSRAEAKAMNFGMAYGMDIGRGKDMSTVVSALKSPNGMMIVDEAHHVNARTYKDIMDKMAASLQLPKEFIDGSMAVANSSAALRYAERARNTVQYMQQQLQHRVAEQFPGVSVDLVPKTLVPTFKREHQGEWYFGDYPPGG